MAIALEGLRLICRMYKGRTFSGKALIYGVQMVEGDYSRVLACLKKEDYPVRELPEAEIRYMDFKEYSEYGTCLHPETLFKMLGFDVVDTIDLYPNENPTHVLDLNLPLPESMYGNYDFILDGGTMEHCFNVPEVFFNTVRLLKPGGIVLHFNPISGMVNHGFYQFSPTLYYDFYQANGFDEMALKFSFLGREMDHTPHYIYNDFLGAPVMGFFTARKGQGAAQAPVTPVQNLYEEVFGGKEAAAAGSNGKPKFKLADLRAKIPSRGLLHFLVNLRKGYKLFRDSRPL